MKLAYLANIRYPSERAHSIQISHMCEAFVKAGNSVTLFVNTRSRQSVPEIIQYYSLPISFVVKRLPYGAFFPKLKPTYYFSEIWFTTNFLFSKKRNDFDIVYSRSEWIIWFLSIFLEPKKLVWESHEGKLNYPAVRLLKKGIKTIVISEGIYKDYIKQHIPSHQLLVAHDGIDESFFGDIESKTDARKRLALPTDKEIIMYIGGFDEWKGVTTFFEASKILKNGITFVAIGGKKEEIKKYKSEYPEVNFLGQRPYSELKNNQQAADILVIPNTRKNQLSSRYTSPLKLFAHMASGIPIIASNVESITALPESSAMWLTESDNPDNLTLVIKSILKDYSATKVKSEELKLRSKLYTWNRRAQRIINFID